jgi:hypothetical protein
MSFKFPNEQPTNFCIAPFHSTRQNAFGRNSPCAFGAGEWEHGQLTPTERWHSKELNDLRQEFIDGKKPDACHRCWAEEIAGKRSLRQRQLEYYPEVYEQFIKTGRWENGPITAVFKTSNVCNLACRSCAGWDSNTYTKEGMHYAETYQTKSFDGSKLHNRFISRLPPKHTNFMDFIPIMDNIEKIDFFGGEPLLNITQLDLLTHLVDVGLSKNITLFYSTNCTNRPTDRLLSLWSKFKRLELSLSIDGKGKQFEYLRWPGKWEEAENIVQEHIALKDRLDCEVYVIGAPTISSMNVYYADDLLSWHKQTIGDYYVNMVNSPSYLAINTLPNSIKSFLLDHVIDKDVRGYLTIEQHDVKLFKQFSIWMSRQDMYRNQRFDEVFAEYFELLKPYWATDLSEENFNSETY